MRWRYVLEIIVCMNKFSDLTIFHPDVMARTTVAICRAARMETVKTDRMRKAA